MQTSDSKNSATSKHIDYDLHGIVGVRLINPSPRDAAAVARQLGPLRAALQREPDIAIKFVDRIDLSSPMRLLGLDDAGFSDDGFFVLRGRHKASAKVKIAFEQIGSRHCEIVCESGVASVPLLIAIINLTFLSKGAIPLHASAFIHNDTGFVITGWSKGGKTEALLSFMSHGARYVGDEWVILTADGMRMCGMPEPIRLWDWHLDQLPQFRRKLSRASRYKLKAIRQVEALYRSIPNAGKSSFLPLSILRRAILILQRQKCVDVAPHRLFGDEGCALAGTPEKIIFIMSHAQDTVSMEDVDAQEIASRMAFSLRYEQADFFSYYMKYRFAFPDLMNPLIERAPEYQLDILSRALHGKDAHAVYHPYPVQLEKLFEIISPLSVLQKKNGGIEMKEKNHTAVSSEEQKINSGAAVELAANE